jgi:hypothetical protein
MPWPLMVLDWARHQLPRTGARCIYASRLAGTGLTSIALIGTALSSTGPGITGLGSIGLGSAVQVGTVQVGGSVATGDGGVPSVTPIRRETSKACTRLT